MTGSRSSSFSRSGSDNESITKHIEVISINDTEQVSSEPIVPHERQVIGDIIQIWKEDPSSETLGVGKLHALVKDRHHNWSLSEKRVKTLLKKFGLSNNATSQFNYASEITSIHDGSLHLPDDIKIIMTNKRGKGLFAKTPIKQGDLIWQEPPYFFVPPLANLKLIKHGKACSYCGKLLPKSFGTLGGSRGLDCNGCSEMWCSTICQRENQHLHCLLKHLRKGQKHLINSEHYLELEDYVIKEDWNALFAICLIYAEILEDKSGEKLAYFKSMARVSQKTRYKALDSSAGSFDSFSGGALFVEEQQERLWKEGFEKFAKVFPNAISSGDIDYPEFLMMLGSYNINNLDSCIFKVHAHLNHSCSPTVTVKTPSTSDRNEGIKVYATKDLSANEELTTSYVNPNHTVQQRQRELRCNWGFTCNCTRCKDELKIQQRRQSNSGQPPRKQSTGNASRKQSNGSPIMDKHDIRKMLNDTKEQIGDEDIDLNIPLNYYGERRKSVRFDEKVIAVSE